MYSTVSSFFGTLAFVTALGVAVTAPVSKDKKETEAWWAVLCLSLLCGLVSWLYSL